MNREDARQTLARLAKSVFEQTDEQAAVRLLERISSSQEPELLRDLLVEEGARAVLRARGAA